MFYTISKMADTNTSAIQNLENLAKCDVKQCQSLLHRIVDGICHRSKPSFEEYSKIWSLQDWWELNDACADLFKQAVKESWTKDQLLHQLQGLSEEYQSLLYDVVASREKDIRNQLLLDTHAISQASMTDFDWKLKLVMSSDKIATVQEPLLSLDLDVQTTQGRKTVSVELSKGQLANLITSLEAANKALVQLKS